MFKPEFRLKRLLAEIGRDSHGIISTLQEETNIKRHTLANYYHNNVVSYHTEIIEKLSQWLYKEGVPREDLPHRLIGNAPGDLWNAIAGTNNTLIYLGQYNQDRGDDKPFKWIAPRDALVGFAFNNELSSHSNPSGVFFRYAPCQWNPAEEGTSMKTFRKYTKEAEKIFQTDIQSNHNSSVILLGSQRVQYCLECFVGDLFNNCQPFHHPHDVIGPPFFTVYRDSVFDFPSCFGSKSNSDLAKLMGREKLLPGLYFVNQNEEWITSEWNNEPSDQGLVLITYDPGTRQVILAAEGFKGRCTDAIGQLLIHQPEHFWPLNVSFKGKQIGVFIIQFEFDEDKEPDNENDVWPVENQKIIQLSEDVIKKRLR